MNHPTQMRPPAARRGERGAGRFQLILVLAVIGAAAYAAYQYVPVAMKASTFKVFMQDTVDRAAAAGQTPAWVEKQLKSGAAEYGVPEAAVYKVESANGRLRVAVRFTRPVSLPGYTYQYEFDHTVHSSAFLESPK
ncbi:MAG TPA: hypothetical protein VER08_08240 [Pyrinomonadaceae bacterium]|nr:hypothetical protein [Pyrinomonadaceae bacterium]